VEDNSDDVDGDMLFVASNSKFPMDSWTLDSVYSFHVMPNRDWFDTYMLVNSSIVIMGDGAHYKFTDIDNIRIKMFDDVVRMLCDVRHIPEVEKNLISLGTFVIPQ
jgi:hypothetical protein